MAAGGEKYNEDELIAPKWLDAVFLTTVLKQSENDEEIEVNDYKISPGSNQGDHLASIIFRAEVNYKQQAIAKQIKVIVKAMPEEGFKKELLQDSKAFHTEIITYRDIIPKVEQTLREVGDDTKFAPRCLYYSLEPHQVIVLEDLVPLGFEVLRDRFPNDEESKSAILKLAKWHAVTHKMIAENPEVFAELRYGLLSEEGVENFEFFTAGIKNFIEVLNTVPSLKSYAAYFESIQPKLISECRKGFREYFDISAVSRYFVLSHGDFHSRNILLKYDSSNRKLLETILIDWQLSSVCSNALDIIYAIYLFCDGKFGFERRDELIYYYFSKFVDTLQKLGFKGPAPKLKEFRRHIKELEAFEIWVLVTFMPLYYADPAEVIDVFTNSEYQKKLFQTEQFIADMERILPKFMHLGYFEA